MKTSLRCLRTMAISTTLLACFTVQGDVIYRETFGIAPGATTVDLFATAFDWQRFDNNGAQITTTGSSSGVNFTVNGRPIDVANVNAGPNSDGTLNAYANGILYWGATPSPSIGFTPEYSFNPNNYVPGSIVFSWYEGNNTAPQIMRLIVRIGSQWYASAATFTTPVVTLANFGAQAQLKTLTYDPAAANWLTLNFNGDFTLGGTPGTGTGINSTAGALALGAAPGSDLSGIITAFGIYGESGGGSGNRRIDTFQIEGTPKNLVAITGTNIWTAAFNGDWDLGSTNWVTPELFPANFLSGSLAIFNDTASNGNVNLTMPLAPAVVVVSNLALPYTFGGSGSITGNASLTKQGAGTLVLDNSGSNDFTLGVTISEGTLQVGNGDANGNLPLGLVVDNAALVFKRSDSYTVASAISGSGTVTKDGAGVLTLSGGNSFTGLVTVLHGTLKAGSGSALGTTAGETIVNDTATLDVNHVNLGLERVTVSGAGVGGLGGIVDNSGNPAFVSALANVTLAGDTTFGGTGRWDLRSTPTTAVNAALASGGNPFKLTKVGTNQVSLVGVAVDPALGDIDIRNGTLSFETVTTSMGNSASNLFVRAGASLSFFASTSQWNKVFMLFGDGANPSVTNMSGSNTMAGPVTLSGNCVFGVAGSNLTCSANIGGGGSLIKHGASALILSGVNDYTGTTTISNGSLFVNGSVLGGGDVTVYGGTLGGVGQIGSSVTIAANGTIAPGNVAGAIGALEVGGTLTLAGTNLMDVTKSAGVVNSDAIVFVGTLSYGGTLRLNLTGEPLTAGDTVALYSFSGASGAFSTIIPAAPGPGLQWDTNQLTVDGSLKVMAGGPPLTWRGLPDGNWNIGTALNWLSEGSPTNYYDGLVVKFDDTATGTTNVNLTTTLSPASVTVSNAALTYAFIGTGKLSGATALTKEGSGKLVVANSGANDYTGGTIITEGTLQFGIGGTEGSLPATGSITNHGALVLNRSSDFAVTNLIVGVGSLTKNGAGTLTLGGPNGYGGGSTVNAGTVRLTNVTAAGTGAIIVNNGALIAGAVFANPMTLAGGSLGAVSGLASIPSTEVMAMAATTSTVYTSDPQSLSVNSEVNLTGLLRGSGNINVVAGTNNLAPDGGVGFRLRGTAASDFSGTITCSNNIKGELQTTVAGPFSPAGTGKIVLVCGAYNGTNSQNAPASGGYSEFNLRNNSAGNSVLGNDMELSGSGLAVLNPLGSAPAGSSVAMGNLRIGNGQELGVYLGANPAHVISFQTVTLSGGTATFSPKGATFGAVTSVGSDLSLGDITEQAPGSGLIMAGLRTLTLTGNNTYSGDTVVNAGTLALSGNGSIAASPTITVAVGATLNVSARTDGKLTLASGQTLKGNGTITGDLAAGANSTVSPGASIGKLSVSGAVTLSGTTRMELNQTSGTNDVLQSAGTIHYGGLLSLTNLEGTLAAGNSFKLFDAPFYADSFAAISPATPGPALVWDTGLLGTSGTLRVAVAPRPGIATLTRSGPDLVVGGTNGTPDQTYTVLTSTNLTLPLIDWTPVLTNRFDAGGNFTFTNAVDTLTAQRFFLLQVP